MTDQIAVLSAGIRVEGRRLLLVLMLALMAFSASAVRAGDVVVTHNVTVRKTPSSRADPVSYPELGTRLFLLDGARLVSGYYHVRLAGGDAGWVYHTFVQRTPSAAASAGDVPVGRMIVHYIDVDQGAAALLEFSCGAVLIDAGGYGAVARDHLLNYLSEFFHRRGDLHNTLAAVFVTHHHDDHDAHLSRLSPYRVLGFVYNGHEDSRITAMLTSRRALSPRINEAPVREADVAAAETRGVTSEVIDPIACEDVDPSIRVLSGGWPGTSGWLNTPNNHSLVIRVDFDRASFLFTGDLETPGIERLIDRYQGTDMLNVDVYAVGHHGADNGTTERMLEAMTPEIAVISVGKPSTTRGRTAFGYGHPRQETIDLLERLISRPRRAPVDIMTSERGNGPFTARQVRHAIYATSRDGDIDVIALPDGTLQVQTSR